MQLEAAAIWRTYGIDLCWRWSSAPRPNGSTRIDVLLDQTQHARARPVLGDTRLPVPPGEYVPIRLDREAIEDVLRVVTFDQVAQLTGHASVRTPDVGRALGRVLAHELGHALMATRGHQPSGLMRSSFTGNEMLARTRDSYGLSPAEVARLWSVQAARHLSADDATSVLHPRG